MTADQTIGVYDRQARRYAEMVAESGPEPDLGGFLARLPKGGRILDLGCGPGHTARRMMDAGFAVEAIDGSAEMVRMARAAGVSARQATFDDLDCQSRYDGVWASFSLLHAPKADLPAHLARIHRALRPSGGFFLGMKLGDGEGVDALGRFYSYYSRDDLLHLLSEAGFTVTDTREGHEKGLAGTLDPFIVVNAHA